MIIESDRAYRCLCDDDTPFAVFYPADGVVDGLPLGAYILGQMEKQKFCTVQEWCEWQRRLPVGSADFVSDVWTVTDYSGE